MEQEGVLLRVMPGDVIRWNIEVYSQARVQVVWAIFVREDEGQARRLVLGGEVHRFEKPTPEGRTNFAELVYHRQHSDPLEYGDYRLEYLECVTKNESRPRVDPESVPPTIIRYEREPADEVPRLQNSHIGTT